MSKKIRQVVCRSIVAFLVLIPGFIQGLAPADTQKNPGDLKTIDRVVAIINDDIITSTELASLVKSAKIRLVNNKIKLPAEHLIRKQVLERLILEHIQLQQAKNTGISVTEKGLEQAINDIAKRNKISRARFLKQVYRDGYTKDSYRKELKKQILIKRLVDKLIRRRINVAESEVDKFIIDRNRISGGKDAYNISHIMLPIPDSPSPEKLDSVRQKANDVLEKLRKGADFQQTAIAHSTGEKALEGGNLGWRTIGELPELFLSSLSSMQAGDISDLIKSPNGFHILKLNELRTTSKSKTVKQTRVRHILARTNEVTSDEEAINKLILLRQRILEGEDFGLLAQTLSEDKGTAIKGGELGWVNPGQTVTEFEKSMNGLKLNEVSKPIKSPFGYHVIQVLERRSRDIGRQLDRAEVRDQLRNKKTEENYQKWVRQIRQEAYVKYVAEWAAPENR